MPNTLTSHTLSIPIARPAGDVYRFVHDPANLPKWATSFCQGVEENAAGWEILTSLGKIKFRMTPENALGVLDHFLTPDSGGEIHVPMRVIPNGEGCEVVFTLFRLPGMTDEEWGGDEGLARADLESLKHVMESGGNGLR